ncbi:hypothetical protein B0H16DRAFT_63529, partial [Mycena metata]
PSTTITDRYHLPSNQSGTAGAEVWFRSSEGKNILCDVTIFRKTSFTVVQHRADDLVHIHRRVNDLSQSWRTVLDNHCFPYTEQFRVTFLESYYAPTTLESAGTFTRLKVLRRSAAAGSAGQYGVITPNVVFIVLLEPESELSSKYRRGMLDHEIRRGMEDMRKAGPLTSIYGIAVFGRRMAVYTKNGDEILPLRPPFDPAADLAPEALWGLEVTSAEGMGRLQEIAVQIKAACADGDTKSIQKPSWFG